MHTNGSMILIYQYLAYCTYVFIICVFSSTNSKHTSHYCYFKNNVTGRDGSEHYWPSWTYNTHRRSTRSWTTTVGNAAQTNQLKQTMCKLSQCFVTSPTPLTCWWIKVQEHYRMKALSAISSFMRSHPCATPPAVLVLYTGSEYNEA